MASRIEIKCINKVEHYNPHHRITHVGGVYDGTSWKITQEDAIRKVENKEYEFFVSRGGYTADVIVATKDGKKYIKTKNDGESPDNLLSLPECP